MMSTYKERRRANLMALEVKHGSLEQLSNLTGVSASYLSQMKKVRHMGDKVARRIEQKLKLPVGWMDETHDGTAKGSAAKGGDLMQLPHYSPDQRVQELLNDLLSIPSGLRDYLHRKVKALKAYSELLTPFQRKNFPSPPADEAGYSAWEKELEHELNKTGASLEGVDDAPASKKRARVKA